MLVTRGSSLSGSRTEDENFKVIKTPFLPLYPFHISVQRRLFRKDFKRISDEFDIIHYHTPLVSSFGPTANGVTTFHSSSVHEANGVEGDLFFKKKFGQYYSRVFSRMYCKDLIKSSRKIIAVSDSLRGDLRSEFGADTQIDVVHNGVDTVQFDFKASAGRGDSYILYVGRLDGRKGLFNLIKAFKSIAASTDTKLVICGEGPIKEQLVSLCQQLSIDKRVTFTGFVDFKTLVSLYQNASIFISPSTYETGPITILEAMSCGTPVITTNVGMVSELIDGINGEVLANNEPRTISEACIALLMDENRRNVMSIEGRKTVESSFTWDNAVDSLLKIYKT